MRCPSCNARVVQKSKDGKLRIRTNLLAVSSDGVEVPCRRCGEPVTVDLAPGATLRKALSDPPRLVLKPVKILDPEKSQT